MHIKQTTTISFKLPDEYAESIKFEETHKDWIKEEIGTTTTTFILIKNTVATDYTIE